MAIIKVPEALRRKLNEDGTDALIGVLNQVEQSAKENSISIVSDRFERRLSEEMSKMDRRISDEMAKMDRRISESHVQTLRWLFAMWATQMAAIIGIFIRVK